MVVGGLHDCLPSLHTPPGMISRAGECNIMLFRCDYNNATLEPFVLFYTNWTAARSCVVFIPFETGVWRYLSFHIGR